MKKVLIFAFFILSSNYLALHSAEVFAQDAETELPKVHILPDNPLYFLKTIKEKVQLLVTRNTAAQANLLLDFSQKRLAEAQKVAEKGKIHISEKLFDAFGKDIEAAQERIKEVKQRGERTYDLLVKLQETVAYQKSVIEKLEGQTGQLGSFLVQVDQDLGGGGDKPRNYIEATPSAKGGLGIFDWLRGLFGKKEILRPLAE